MKVLFVIFITLYSINAFALYTENIPEQCGILANNMIASFTPNTHTCSNGYYLPAGVDECTTCTFGHSCSGGTYTFNETIDQGISIGTYTCNSGYYLPAGIDECKTCTFGHSCSGGTYTFNETIDQGLVVGSYTCNSGYFLPANTLGCATCPTDYTCSGGTYSFNENEYQGAVKSQTYITHNLTNMCATNAPHELIAVFTPNVYNCSSGYYLPANVDGCTKCPNNSYCPGGTYTFNETTDQGIVSCPSAHPFSPTGMWQQSQCGRKLHVGDDVVYMHQSPANPTTHRLFISYQNNIYSANAIPRDMNSNTFPKMSTGMSKGLHVKINDVEYLICDDSVPECRNDQ